MSVHIKIVKRPAGEAPEWVRDAWIGVRLRALNEAPMLMEAVGVLTGPRSAWALFWAKLWGAPRAFQHTGYVTDAREAIDTLAASQPDAAQWWRQNCPHLLRDGKGLMFQANECVLDDDPAN